MRANVRSWSKPKLVCRFVWADFRQSNQWDTATYKYIYIYRRVYIFICACIYMCVCVWIYTYIYIYMYMTYYTYTYTYIYKYTHVYEYIFIYICIHTYSYIVVPHHSPIVYNKQVVWMVGTNRSFQFCNKLSHPFSQSVVTTAKLSKSWVFLKCWHKRPILCDKSTLLPSEYTIQKK